MKINKPIGMQGSAHVYRFKNVTAVNVGVHAKTFRECCLFLTIRGQAMFSAANVFLSLCYELKRALELHDFPATKGAVENNQPWPIFNVQKFC